MKSRDIQMKPATHFKINGVSGLCRMLEVNVPILLQSLEWKCSDLHKVWSGSVQICTKFGVEVLIFAQSLEWKCSDLHKAWNGSAHICTKF